MYLGLDLGTSGLRGLLVSDAGVVGAAEAHYTVANPHPGWAEQDPDAWITALDQVMAALRAAHGPALAKLQGIAVAGHMHGAVALGADHRPLRPCILWNDTRAHAEAAQLDATPGVREVSGNIVFPGFTAPKLMWMRENEREISVKVALVLLPKDYVTLHLTGEAVSDMSDAAGTSWLDVGARDWSDTLLKASGMRLDQMPKLVEGSDAVGTLRPELAQRWGLPRSVVIAGGAADNAGAAFGVGALGEGSGFVSLGTSGVILAGKDGFAPDPATAVHTFCHAIPDRWYQMAVILAATDSLNWLARQMGQTPASLTKTFTDLDGPGRVQFLPYLSGERTPHNDSHTRGALLHLDVAHGPQDLTRAVMEGVAFALRDGLQALQTTGTELESALAIGGGTGSRYWTELCATVLNMPLELPEQGEFGAAMGAARLAQCAATGADATDIMTKPKIAETIAPNNAYVDAYNDAYANWRAAYPQIKDLP